MCHVQLQSHIACHMPSLPSNAKKLQVAAGNWNLNPCWLLANCRPETGNIGSLREWQAL
jgi:hypothetical protein